MDTLAPTVPPQLLGMPDRVNTSDFPPFFLITNRMERPVMGDTKRHGPFITDLAAHGPRLGKTYVMGMAR